MPPSTTAAVAALEALGGIARRARLLARGVSDVDIRFAWASGSIIRVRNGVYALPTVPRDVLRAVRVGGALAAGSAASLHGVWSPPGLALHVSVLPNANGLRDPDDSCKRLTRRHRDVVLMHDGHRLGATERFLVGRRTCILQTMRLADPAIALAVLDSAVRAFQLGSDDLRGLRQALPKRLASVVDAADGSAESGTESVLRWGLIQEGIRFEAQKWLASHIRVDFLLEGFLVVECVSHEHHSSPRQYQADRERIAHLVRLGYVVLEFTYHQVLFDRPAVLETIIAALIRA